MLQEDEGLEEDYKKGSKGWQDSRLGFSIVRKIVKKKTRRKR